MVNKKSMMKVNLCESLRGLMLKRPFEKITIKNICDETGVIRATFYNHFEDKYDCLNAIIYEDIHEAQSHSNNDHHELIKCFINNLEENREFYKIAYRVEGQNRFKDMMIDNIAIVINDILTKRRNDYLKDEFNNLFISRYYATMIELYVHECIFSTNPINFDRLNKLLKSSFSDFIK